MALVRITKLAAARRWTVVAAIVPALWACDPKKLKLVKDREGAAKHDAPPPDATAAVTPPGAPPAEAACVARKDPRTFVTSLVQDMAGRQPTDKELAAADSGDFDHARFVDDALASSLLDDAITKFVSRLLRTSNLVLDPKSQDPTEGLVLADLRQEPVVLVTRNKDKPWKYFFTTRDIYCTENTAKLYDYPLKDTPGFVACTMPPERAGFLGLVSVLRSTSPDKNPQAFYKPNNNYHRVATAVYFATGIQLLSNTNAPPGTGRGVLMPSCAPVTDMRVTKTGTLQGTATIPLNGPACATCHSPHMGPLSVAFRHFGPQGELLRLEDVDKLAQDETNGTRAADLKAILGEERSCWSPDGTSPPSEFYGLAGLGAVIADSRTLGKALGVQIPQHLSNATATDSMIAAIEASYWARGETLQAAMRGYFLSEAYLCDANPQAP